MGVVASLARRVRLPMVTIRLLNRYVRPLSGDTASASPSELAEYAAALNQIGATNEAIQLLRQVNRNEVVDSLLFESFAHFALGDYSTAIPLLRMYIEQPGLEEYALLVGKLNLAVSYVQERRHGEADNLLRELLRETASRKHTLLFGNALELSTENAILRKDWEIAEAYISEAEKVLSGAGGLDEFFVRKWRAVLNIVKDYNPTTLMSLEQIKQEAIGKRLWERVRECDRYLCIFKHDIENFLKLYFGTPNVGFRNRLISDFGDLITIPTNYTWFPSGSREGCPLLDLTYTESAESFHALKRGEIVYRLACSLVSDFYKPKRIAAIHESIYPGEYFNPVSSPNRVRQVIHRFRKWTRLNGLPLWVVEQSYSYHINATSPLGICVGVAPILTKAEARLYRIRSLMNRQEFSSEEAAKILNMSSRTARRLLLSAIESGSIHRFSSDGRTRYMFSGDAKKEAA